MITVSIILAVWIISYIICIADLIYSVERSKWEMDTRLSALPWLCLTLLMAPFLVPSIIVGALSKDEVEE